jgi:hypothetical protein
MNHFAKIVLCLLFVSLSARADWRGKMTITSSGSAKPVSGKVSGKGDLLRFDLEIRGHQVSSIMNYKSEHVTILLHAQKLSVPALFDPVRFGVVCPPERLEACLASRGFKVTGSEKVNGHPCAVYEGDLPLDGHAAHQKLWHPQDLKEVPFIRASTDTGQRTTTVNVVDVHVGALADSHFLAPESYKAIPYLDPKLLPPELGFSTGGQGAAKQPSPLPSDH